MSPRRLIIWIALILALGGFSMYALYDLYAQRADGREAPAPRLDVYGRIGDFAFTDHDGKPYGSEQLTGRVWVVDFIFTRCSGTCPRMSSSLADVQRALGKDDNSKLVSITCDPEHDTPERLREYMKRYAADPKRWTFLTGDFEKVQSFAISTIKLGLRKASQEEIDEGNERIMHSQRFALIDRHMQVRGYYDGTSKERVRELIRDIARLRKEP